MIVVLRYLSAGLPLNCESQLAGAIDVDDTTLSVTATEGAKFPSYIPFLLQCESEIMTCTAKSSDTFTVSRHEKGTAAASHSSGTPIRAILYTNDLDLDRIVCNNGEVVVSNGKVVYN